jgi:hypothetical protein
MTIQQSVWAVFQEMKEDDYVIEDRREYEKDQLQKMYNLTETEADQLYRLVQGEFTDKTSLYRSNWTETQQNMEDAVLLAETISESIHQGYDGWSDEEKVVIQLYLNDIGVALFHSK